MLVGEDVLDPIQDNQCVPRFHIVSLQAQFQSNFELLVRYILSELLERDGLLGHICHTLIETRTVVTLLHVGSLMVPLSQLLE